jgi:hypothetical protein
MCGNNGMGSVADIYRAEVLDPLATPQINLNVRFIYNTSNTGNAFSNGGTIMWRFVFIYSSFIPFKVQKREAVVHSIISL